MKRHIVAAAWLLAALMLLSGCGNVPLNWVIGRDIVISADNLYMTEPEVRLIALEYKAECEKCYTELLGSDFWNLPASAEFSYHDYIKEYYIWKECKALLYLNRMFEAENYSLSSIDNERIVEAAETYYTSMSPDDRAFTDAGRSDVRNVIRKYYIGQLMAEELLGDNVIEVSDEESRVMDIEVIHLQTEEAAQKVYDRLVAGENFATVAKESTISGEVTYTVSRETLLPAISEIVFSLGEGEISNIIKVGEEYYIIRANSSYDVLLSSKNKMNLLAEKRFSGWQEVYDRYESSVDLKRNSYFWKNLDLRTEGEFAEKDLFSLFRK